MKDYEEKNRSVKLIALLPTELFM